MEKSATLLAYLLSKLTNEQGGIFRLLQLQAGWKENLKNLSEHALLLGTSELADGFTLSALKNSKKSFFSHYKHTYFFLLQINILKGFFFFLILNLKGFWMKTLKGFATQT